MLARDHLAIGQEGGINLWPYVDSVGKPSFETNLYSYAANNPVNRIDPLGLDSLLFHGRTLYWINDEGEILRQYSAISGGFGPSLPKGFYYGQNFRRRTYKGMVCPSGGWSLDLNPEFRTNRKYLRIHPDQPPVGTEGCIGVECSVSGQLYDQLRNYFGRGYYYIPVVVP